MSINKFAVTFVCQKCNTSMSDAFEEDPVPDWKTSWNESHVTTQITG